MEKDKTDLFGWFEREKTFTVDEVKELIEKIKVFNAGAIDEYLTKHVDKVLEEWIDQHKE